MQLSSIILDRMKAANPSPTDASIAARLQALRSAQGLSLSQLAAASGVSKAMISRVERTESSPTAAVLGRLAAGLGISLGELFAPPAPEQQRLHRRAEQPTWRDPEIGYRRRQVAPLDPATGTELVEVELPRGKAVHYPRWSGRPYAQRLWLLDGHLQITYGEEAHALDPGDCLDLAVDQPLAFKAVTACRYLLVIAPGP